MLDLEKAKAFQAEIVASNKTYSGHGYIIPAKKIDDLVSQLQAHLELCIKQSYMDGINEDSMTPELDERFDADIDYMGAKDIQS